MDLEIVNPFEINNSSLQYLHSTISLKINKPPENHYCKDYINFVTTTFFQFCLCVCYWTTIKQNISLLCSMNSVTNTNLNWNLSPGKEYFHLFLNSRYQERTLIQIIIFQNFFDTIFLSDLSIHNIKQIRYAVFLCMLISFKLLMFKTLITLIIEIFISSKKYNRQLYFFYLQKYYVLVILHLGDNWVWNIFYFFMSYVIRKYIFQGGVPPSPQRNV